MCVCVCVCARACARADSSYITHTHTHTHTYIYIYIYTVEGFASRFLPRASGLENDVSAWVGIAAHDLKWCGRHSNCVYRQSDMIWSESNSIIFWNRKQKILVDCQRQQWNSLTNSRHSSDAIATPFIFLFFSLLVNIHIYIYICYIYIYIYIYIYKYVVIHVSESKSVLMRSHVHLNHKIEDYSLFLFRVLISQSIIFKLTFTKMFFVQWLSLEIESAAQVQILDEAASVSFYANTLEKGMNTSVLIQLRVNNRAERVL